ncbi:MAG: 4Fe-4S dicluster domain-containing protein [Deltaproteobacteria bacterium]|jgi:Fe-S oxidoreductase|nr:4Fe-4S dicluster domain-containing protein [Deltaproteobacteria bacterium]
MDQNDLLGFENCCVQEQLPRCQARCPFHLDVRGFMTQMRKGQMQAARACLDRHLPCPGILGRICDHPCESGCLREDFGGAVAIGNLERCCLENAPKGGKLLPRAKKDKKTAILGASLASFAAAWDLSGKAYPVTLFYAEAAPSAWLCSYGLPPDIIDAELERLKERGVVFERHIPDVAFLAACRDNFQSVFLDARYLPEQCPSGEDLNPLTGSLDDFSLCFGGYGNSVSEQAFSGRRAATTLDRFMGGSSPLLAREAESQRQTSLWTPLDKITSVPRLAEACFKRLDSSAAALEEAGRCLLCECLACARECAFLRHYKIYPKAYARKIFLNVTMVKGHRLATNMINSCALCGLCEALCPGSFSMTGLTLRARRDMVANGHQRQSDHEFALGDMEQANSPDSFLARSPQGFSTCGRVFFPGCQLAAARGEQIEKVLAHLQANLAESVGIWLGCCGIPAHWAGRETRFDSVVANTRRIWNELGQPQIIAACSSCIRAFRLGTPELPVVSLWETLAEEALPPPVEFKPASPYVINDPCSARHDRKWLLSVRALLERREVSYVEPEMSGEKTSCCGYGGLVWNANPEVADAMAESRAGDLGGEFGYPALSSCIMCRDRLAEQKKDSLHLLDVFWPGLAYTGPGPGLSKRRFNRAVLKRNILKNFYRAGAEETELPERMKLEIAADLLTRMERRHILIEDIEKVVQETESGGQRFLDKESGHFLAASRLGNMTFWVEFTVSGDAYTIHDAYCHRMIVPGFETGS